MSFDVRTPIGVLFLLMGGLVAGYGLIAQPIRAGINIDLVWGVVMAAFGAVLVLLAILARRGELPPPREG
jgi:hypothetical protein